MKSSYVTLSSFLIFAIIIMGASAKRESDKEYQKELHACIREQIIFHEENRGNYFPGMAESYLQSFITMCINDEGFRKKASKELKLSQ